MVLQGLTGPLSAIRTNFMYRSFWTTNLGPTTWRTALVGCPGSIRRILFPQYPSHSLFFSLLERMNESCCFLNFFFHQLSGEKLKGAIAFLHSGAVYGDVLTASRVWQNFSGKFKINYFACPSFSSFFGAHFRVRGIAGLLIDEMYLVNPRNRLSWNSNAAPCPASGAPPPLFEFLFPRSTTFLSSVP